jgi:hypothetical protein
MSGRCWTWDRKTDQDMGVFRGPMIIREGMRLAEKKNMDADVMLSTYKRGHDKAWVAYASYSVENTPLNLLTIARDIPAADGR